MRDSERRVPKSMAPGKTKVFVTNLVLVVTAFYFLLPIWWLGIQSTKTYADMLGTAPLLPAEHNNFWANVQLTLEYDGGPFLRWVGNSIFYSGATAVIGTLVSLACGYAISKFPFRGKKALLGMIVGGMLLPHSLLTIPMFFFFANLGITNTIWAILIPCSVSPFGVFLSVIYCETVPNELIEAARIDGLSEIKIFFTMVIRLLAPAVVTIGLFIFVATWNDFLLPMVMLRGKELMPVTLGLYTWQNYKADILTPQVLTGAFLSIMPVVLLFLALQRYWRSGLTQGAVKA